MANKKKTEIEEATSTKKKKGITKVNTTRTQKIVEKAKTEGKRTASPKAVKESTKPKTTKTSSAKKTATKTSTKKTTTKSATKKETPKTTTAKTTTRKPRTKKSIDNDKITSTTPLVQDFAESEYYDLPFTYNQTVVKILAQTPGVLFVYWDISEEDRKNYIEKYGENFFADTKPVLIITNKTMNYTFEVDINDFANSWYLHVEDAKCEYNIELGRRPISHHIEIPDNYLYVASSNTIEAPNDRILFEKAQNMVYFKNVKTDDVSAKNIANLSFINNMGKIYNIYDVYKTLYKDEAFDETTKNMGSSSSILK